MARDPDGKCFKALSAAKYIAIAKPKSSVPGDIRPIGIVLNTNLKRVVRLRVADLHRSGLGLCNSGLGLRAPGLGLAP